MPTDKNSNTESSELKHSLADVKKATTELRTHTMVDTDRIIGSHPFFDTAFELQLALDGRRWHSIDELDAEIGALVDALNTEVSRGGLMQEPIRLSGRNVIVPEPVISKTELVTITRPSAIADEFPFSPASTGINGKFAGFGYKPSIISSDYRESGTLLEQSEGEAGAIFGARLYYKVLIYYATSLIEDKILFAAGEVGIDTIDFHEDLKRQSVENALATLLEINDPAAVTKIDTLIQILDNITQFDGRTLNAIGGITHEILRRPGFTEDSIEAAKRRGAITELIAAYVPFNTGNHSISTKSVLIVTDEGSSVGQPSANQTEINYAHLQGEIVLRQKYKVYDRGHEIKQNYIVPAFAFVDKKDESIRYIQFTDITSFNGK